ncbi:hypothetical protein ACQKFO_21460 [Rossellomorea sp. NPDC071047]|uniref:hypothetical protein n=1 Tax=Rossellomorea sp. NPDC071047 TaxID=3390675 RepID=UPI003CFFF647
MTFYSVMPFSPKEVPDDPFAPKDFNEDAGLTTKLLEGSMPTVYDTGMTIITIVFVIAVIVAIMALTFKNGQWTKWSTGVMITTLLIILSFRGLPILFFSSDAMGMKLIIDDALNLVKSMGIYAAILMMFIGLLFRFNHNLINHPEYSRWSKRLFIGSILTAALIIIMPTVFLGI